jgi:hypothetical protein
MRENALAIRVPGGPPIRDSYVYCSEYFQFVRLERKRLEFFSSVPIVP